MKEGFLIYLSIIFLILAARMLPPDASSPWKTPFKVQKIFPEKNPVQDAETCSPDDCQPSKVTL